MKIVFEMGDRRWTVEAHTLKASGMFLDLRGGGLTERHTVLAMEDQRAVMAGEPITVNGVDIYTED